MAGWIPTVTGLLAAGTGAAFLIGCRASSQTKLRLGWGGTMLAWGILLGLPRNLPGPFQGVLALIATGGALFTAWELWRLTAGSADPPRKKSAPVEPISSTGEATLIQRAQESALRSGILGVALVTDDRITWCHPTLAGMLGLSPDATLGRSPEELLPPTQEDGFHQVSVPFAQGEGRRHCRSLSVPLPGETRHRAWMVEDVTPYAEVLERERALHLFLETVIDTADVWINTLDNDAKVVLWNKAAERISGYSREEVQGNASIWPLLYPDPAYLAEVAGKAASILAEQDVARDFETTIRTKSGETRTLSWDSRALRNEQNQVTGSLAIARDVTELRKAQAELEQVHLLQGLIVQHNALGLALIRQERFVWVNPRIPQLLQREPSQILDQSIRILFRDESEFQATGQMIVERLASGLSADFRLRVHRRNGSQVWCRCLGKALEPSVPERGSIWVIEDIQQTVEAEARLSESEARLRAVFEGTQDGLLLFTRNRVFDGNQRAVDLLGFSSKEELLGRSMLELSSSTQEGGLPPSQAWNQKIQDAQLNGSVLFNWAFRPPDRSMFRAQVMVSAFTLQGRHMFQASLRPMRDT